MIDGAGASPAPEGHRHLTPLSNEAGTRGRRRSRLGVRRTGGSEEFAGAPPQLAALACGREDTRRRSEALLTACLGDSGQLARVTDATVCHGWAGLFLAADRAAADADVDSPLRRTLPSLRAKLTAHLAHHPIPEGAGLLTGADGVRLTIHTLMPSHSVASGWETCLLLN